MTFGGTFLSSPGGSDGKESACSAGDLGSIPGSGRSPGEVNGSPLQDLARRIPWTEEPGGLQSMVLQRIRSDRVPNFLLAFSSSHYTHCK